MMIFLQVVDGYFVHYFAPVGLPAVDKNVLFVLDTSGSMAGTKIKQLREVFILIWFTFHNFSTIDTTMPVNTITLVRTYTCFPIF